MDEMNRAEGAAPIMPRPGRSVQPPEPPERYRYSIQELEEETGIPARTIRYYITRGLLAPAYGRGPSARYDLGHLLRLRLIEQLKEQRLSLEEIRERLGELSDADVEELLHVQTGPSQEHWRRIKLHPDIELHVRERTRPGQQPDREFEQAVELIIGLAQPVIDRLKS
jgi:DNA-binding transcriptional MerR regulator